MKKPNLISTSAKGFNEPERLLEEASRAFDSLSSFRERRRRCRNYAFGNQWRDPVVHDGVRMTEYDYILTQGGCPMKNNLIGRIVRNVLGIFHKRLEERRTDESDRMKRLREENSLDELYCRTMHEFLISGMAVHRKWIGFRNGRQGVWTEAVSPSNFFVDAGCSDPRGNDAALIGQHHRVDFRTWCSQFVRTPLEYEQALVYFPSIRGERRVTEIWRREQRPRLLVHDTMRGNISVKEMDEPVGKGCRTKWMLQDVWRYYFVDQDANILRQGDSPYIHGSHPYVFKGYPFLEGEIYSFVEDIIDQQRYTNRLITLYDWIIRATAKGVLLVPEDSVPLEWMDNVIKEWSRFDGVIRYKGKPGMPEPHQVSATGSAAGVAELLEIQLKMLEDVSGVTATLRGNTSSTSVSGSLFSQQTENALTSLTDILCSFDSFMAQCTLLDEMLLRQTGVNSE